MKCTVDTDLALLYYNNKYKAEEPKRDFNWTQIQEHDWCLAWKKSLRANGLVEAPVLISQRGYFDRENHSNHAHIELMLWKLRNCLSENIPGCRYKDYFDMTCSPALNILLLKRHKLSGGGGIFFRMVWHITTKRRSATSELYFSLGVGSNETLHVLSSVRHEKTRWRIGTWCSASIFGR